MFVLLSHPIDETSPGWPGNPKYSLKRHTSVEKGEMANTCLIELFNHYGTHFDAPYHFNLKGPKIAELPFEEFVFERPVILDIPKTYREKYQPEDFKPFYDQIKKADLVMIKSGLSPDRKTRPDDYANNGPAISTEAAKYLMDNFRIKAIIVDWLSIASPLFLEDADMAHQYLLGRHHDHHTYLIEDADFTGVIGKKIKRIFAIPLIMKGVDSSPVTVFAECE